MFMDLYAHEGYMGNKTFDWTTLHASKSSKSTPSAGAALANVSRAKYEPRAAQ
jgi:hypothetical protein